MLYACGARPLPGPRVRPRAPVTLQCGAQRFRRSSAHASITAAGKSDPNVLGSWAATLDLPESTRMTDQARPELGPRVVPKVRLGASAPCRRPARGHCCASSVAEAAQINDTAAAPSAHLPRGQAYRYFGPRMSPVPAISRTPLRSKEAKLRLKGLALTRVWDPDRQHGGLVVRRGVGRSIIGFCFPTRA